MKIAFCARVPGVATALACAGLLAGTAPSHAQDSAHRHGAIRMEVALESTSLTVRLDAPLDSLLGFEHRPRTDSQRRAADAMLARLRNASGVVVPPAAAQCSVKDVAVEADVLSPAKSAGTKQPQDQHADLEATYSFNCLQPDKLQALELGLFAAFPRLQRIDAHVVSSRAQSAVTLRRPQQVLRLGK